MKKTNKYVKQIAVKMTSDDMHNLKIVSQEMFIDDIQGKAPQVFRKLLKHYANEIIEKS